MRISKTQATTPFLVTVLVILLIAFGLRVYALDSASLWYDEALTFMRVQDGVVETIRITLGRNTQLPLYFVLLAVFPNDTDVTLRYPSVLAGLLGVAAVIGITRRLYGSPRKALWAGALIAANPLLIWLSRTARPYALLFVLLLLASYSFLVLLRKPDSKSNLILFTLSSMAAYATHYFALVLPMAQYITLGFMLTQRKAFRRWFTAQVIAGIPLLIWFALLTQRESVRLAIEWIREPTLSDIPLTLWNLTVGYTGEYHLLLWPGFIASIVGIGAGVYFAIRHWKTERPNLYWSILISAPLAVVFIVSITFRPVYEDRYLIFMIVGLVFLIVAGWERLSPKMANIALGLIVVSGALHTLASLYTGDHIREDWKGAAAFIQAAQGPQDGILVDNQLSLYAFMRYYSDLDALEYTQFFGKTGFDPYVPQPVHDTLSHQPERLWAIYRNGRDDCHRQGKMQDFDPFAPGVEPIGDWLIAHREQIREIYEFNGVKVILLDNPIPGTQ